MKNNHISDLELVSKYSLVCLPRYGLENTSYYIWQETIALNVLLTIYTHGERKGPVFPSKMTPSNHEIVIGK